MSTVAIAALKTAIGNYFTAVIQKVTNVESALESLPDNIETTTGAANKVAAHAELSNNPHGVTKAQVGLTSVENYGIATQVQAQEGTVNNAYMTPLRTAEAIQTLAVGTTTELIEALQQSFDDAIAELEGDAP